MSAQPRPVSSVHDVFRAAHPVATRKEGTVHLFTGRTGGQRIDWILASAHFKTIACEIDRTRGPSDFQEDHFLVTATLRIAAAMEPQQRPVARRE
jgi:endonuclease/exonuclease/phosphatase family metal-dependent hydrolase